MSYTPASGTLGPSWVGTAYYQPSHSVVGASWDSALRLFPAGVSPGSFGAHLVTKQQFINPSGFTPAQVSAALITLDWQYIPPYQVLSASWVGKPTYTTSDDTLSAQWFPGVPGSANVFPDDWVSSVVASPLVWVYQFVSPTGWTDSQFGRTRAYRSGDYLPYDAILDASWVGAPNYAPRGDVLLVGWHTTIGTPKILPFGWTDSQFGTVGTVRNAVSYIYPSTIQSLQMGTAVIVLHTQYVPPIGFVATDYGQATVVNHNIDVLVGGIAPPTPAFGTAFIAYRNRTLLPAGIAVPTTQAPAPVVTHIIQYVDLAGRSITSAAYGTPSTTFADREIFPVAIAATSYGVATVARIQVILPSGWESSVVDVGPHVDINLQRLFPDSGSADPAIYGATTARNQHENVNPIGWLSQEINFPIVYNVDQHVLVSPYMDTNSDPTQWPNYYPFVENKKRVLGPSGFQSSRFSVIGNLIENKARPLYPLGIDSQVFGSDTFIAHYVRNVYPDSWDNFYSSHYAVVYNAAKVIAPSGWISSSFGTPNPVLNLNRTIKHVLPYDGEVFGTSFVAYRIRTIAQGLFYDVPSGFPEVRYDPYPIAPPSINPPQFGAVFVEERFTRIYPASTNVHSMPWVGEPIVENRNKTLRVFPSDQLVTGLAKVFNYIQHSDIGGYDLLVVGDHLVAYRTKKITPATIGAPRIVVTHRIRNLIPDPPAPQRAAPIGLAPPLILGHTVSLRTVSVPSISSEFAVGATVVTTNAIRPMGIFFDDTVGSPTVPVPQPVFPQSIPLGNEFFLLQVPTGVRFDPFHIYAPAGDQRPVGYTPTNAGLPISMGAVFGVSTVTNRHRTIGPVPDHSLGRLNRPTVFGDAYLELRLRIVSPYGIARARIPAPVFWGVPQYVEFGGEFGQPGIASTNTFGTTVVARYVDPHATQYITPSGLVATVYGSTRIELFNRQIALSGIPHRGNPQEGNTSPWGVALVGYPRRYVISAGDTTLWGTTLIEYKNRTVYGLGFSANTLDDDDIEERIDPMRVSRRNPPGGISSIQSALVFGLADVSHLIRDIYARGPNTFASGSHTVLRYSTIKPAGWDSAIFGDIDRWEEGKVKPYGDDLSVMGTPRMLHTVRPIGFYALRGSSAGFPRFGTPLYPTGLPAIGFAGPSVSNPFGCTNRVVVPLPVLSALTVGAPTVNRSMDKA